MQGEAEFYKGESLNIIRFEQKQKVTIWLFLPKGLLLSFPPYVEAAMLKIIPLPRSNFLQCEGVYMDLCQLFGCVDPHCRIAPRKKVRISESLVPQIMPYPWDPICPSFLPISPLPTPF